MVLKPGQSGAQFKAQREPEAAPTRGRYEVQTFGPLDADELAWSTLFFWSRAAAHEAFMRIATERGKNGIGVKMKLGNVTIAKFTQIAENE